MKNSRSLKLESVLRDWQHVPFADEIGQIRDALISDLKDRELANLSASFRSLVLTTSVAINCAVGAQRTNPFETFGRTLWLLEQAGVLVGLRDDYLARKADATAALISAVADVTLGELQKLQRNRVARSHFGTRRARVRLAKHYRRVDPSCPWQAWQLMDCTDVLLDRFTSIAALESWVRKLQRATPT